MLIFAFAKPHFEYGLLIWVGATASNLEPVQNKVKEAIRKMSFKKTGTQQKHCSNNLTF